MAKTLVITDDLDGATGAETVSFSYQGREFVIDLGKKNRSAFEKALAPYIGAARTAKLAGKRKPPTSNRRRATGATDVAAVRAWAADNGIEVSSRGRISAEVLQRYSAAH